MARVTIRLIVEPKDGLKRLGVEPDGSPGISAIYYDTSDFTLTSHHASLRTIMGNQRSSLEMTIPLTSAVHIGNGLRIDHEYSLRGTQALVSMASSIDTEHLNLVQSPVAVMNRKQRALLATFGHPIDLRIGELRSIYQVECKEWRVPNTQCGMWIKAEQTKISGTSTSALSITSKCEHADMGIALIALMQLAARRGLDIIINKSTNFEFLTAPRCAHQH